MGKILHGGAKILILISSKLLFLTRENKIHIFKPKVTFLLLYAQFGQSKIKTKV